MSNITEYEPKRVFHYFNEISKIPHGSYNTAAMTKFLVDFAKAQGLEYIEEEIGNVIIKKPASPGYEKSAPILLQGHMDMVCTVAPGCTKDMTKEGLDLVVDGDWLTAEGTTLGGDDGAAVAYMLALAESDEFQHPALELVFTVDEETGLEGADAIDTDHLAARKMINLDSEEEGIITVSCAGGITGKVHLPIKREEKEGELCTLTIGGLKSGHSGTDINLELGNANILMGRVLYDLSKVTEVSLISMAGGNADNVICQECVAEIIVSDTEKLASEIDRLDAVLKNEYKTSDPGVFVKAELEGVCRKAATDADSTRRVLGYLMTAPYGVQNMSMDIKDLTETSLNLGALKLEEDEMTALYALRSSVMTRQAYLQDKLTLACEAQGGTVEYSFFYPAWEFRKDSPLRDVCVKVYQEMFGKEPLVEAIHAGLECGIFAGKMGGEFDAVSIGPQMVAVHTADEKLSISSTKRTWEYLLEILKESK